MVEVTATAGHLPGAKRKRLDSLTGLRAFAAFVVFLNHNPMYGTNLVSRIYEPFFVNGAAGVTFFFMLSGFVLTWSASLGDTKANFWFRRFARIYPAYVVATLFGIIVVIHEGTTVRFGHVLTTLALTQSWVPSQAWYFSLNGVSWSLSCEAFFYLCFPLFLTALLRMSSDQRRVLQIACVASVFATATIGILIDGQIGRQWFTNHLPPIRMIEFVFGCTLAIDLAHGHRLRMGYKAAFALATAAYLLSAHFYGAYSNIAFPMVPFALLLFAAAQADVDKGGSFFSKRAIVWLGEISYCFYLVHQLVSRTIRREAGRHLHLGGTEFLVATAIPAMAISIVLAWLLHAKVEKPFERQLKRFWAERMQAQPLSSRAIPVAD